MPLHAVGVLGATSLVGESLRRRLIQSGQRVLACSRHPPPTGPSEATTWCVTGRPTPVDERVARWIALSPAWATVDAFDWMRRAGCTRLVALSSTSVFTKQTSPDAGERALAVRLAQAEDTLTSSAGRAGIALVILRPTMIYDGHSDGNVARIAGFVRRFGWFPVCKPANGLRQPVHADDVAAACVAAIDHAAPQATYTISGGEVLSFRDLVSRTCAAHDLTPRLVQLPVGAWRIAALFSRLLGLGVTLGTALRMNDDLSCDHVAALQDLGFRPRPFQPSPSRTDLPPETSRWGVAP